MPLGEPIAATLAAAAARTMPRRTSLPRRTFLSRKKMSGAGLVRWLTPAPERRLHEKISDEGSYIACYHPAMQRRNFVKLVGGSALWPLAAQAQQPAMRRLGMLILGAPDDSFGKGIATTFTGELASLGWHEGANLRIDWRWYGADAALAERQARELLALGPDALVAGGNPAVEVLRRQTKSIPVVFAVISDPVGMGYAASLAHPGGNLTGFSSYDPPVYTKEFQMLTEITPPASTIAALYNPATAPYASRMVGAVQAGAKSLGVVVRDAPCHDEAGIEAVMISLAQGGNGGLVALGDIFTQVHREAITGLALKYKIPTVVNTRQIAESGGMIGYVLDIPDLFNRAAVYVDRVLKGAKPADLPVQLPNKFELIINLKTAKSLGVKIPPSLIATADRVIE
jgi:putative ABC transport system substrate-binding protein